MDTLVITGSKIDNWQEYCACLTDQKISTVLFRALDEPHLKLIITILDKQPKLLASVTKIEFGGCSFGKSTNERFTKLIKPSVKTLIFNNTRFIDDGAVICSKLPKLTTLEEISFDYVQLGSHAGAHIGKLMLKQSPIINLKLFGAGAASICQQVCEKMKICSNLKSLEFQDITYDFIELFTGIASNTSLTKLVLSGKQVAYDLQPLEKANLKTNLVELELRDFDWVNIGSSIFLNTIGDYTSLTKLVINNVNRERQSDQLATSIPKLTQLKTLDITNFSLTDSLKVALQSNTTITDLTCTRGTYFDLTASKCQNVNLHVNLRSLTLLEYNNTIKKAVQQDDIALALIIGNLTKLKLHQVTEFDTSKFVEALNSSSCHVTDLEVFGPIEDQRAIELINGLKTNTKITNLALTSNLLSNRSVMAIYDMLLVNRYIQCLRMVDSPAWSLGDKTYKLIELLKINKTLLYLEVTVSQLLLNSCADKIVQDLSPANSTLLEFKPFSNDYRVDMWLRRNRQLQGVVSIILANIMRAGSVLPLEIWIKIFEYYDLDEAQPQ